MMANDSNGLEMAVGAARKMIGSSTFSRHRLLLAVVAVAIVVTSSLTARFVHQNIILQRNTAQLTELSGQLLSRAELAIDYAVITLGNLLSEGAVDCGAGALHSARKQVLLRGSIKAIEVVNRVGGPNCTTMDVEDGFFSGADGSKSQPARNPSISIEKPMIEQDGLVRVVWKRNEGLYLVALINIDTLMFDVFPSALRENSNAALLLGEGTVLARFNNEDATAVIPSTQLFEHKSERYPISSRLIVERHDIRTWNRGSFVPSTTAGILLGSVLAFLVIKLVCRRRDPVEELAAAIAKGEIVPYFQPIFDLASREITGGEALARWIRQDGTVVAPDQFIPLAESAGLVNELTFALMNQAFGQLGPLLENKGPFKLAFNVTPEQFVSKGFLRKMIELASSWDVAPHNLVVELTERQTATDKRGAARVSREARALGIRIALDDIGTGHNGLSNMQEMEMDFIKIDKKFVDLVTIEQSAGLIIKMLVGISRELGMRTVAEGIETESQLESLLALGVEEGQGYLVSPPLPGDAFVDFLQHNGKYQPGTAGAGLVGCAA